MAAVGLPPLADELPIAALGLPPLADELPMAALELPALADELPMAALLPPAAVLLVAELPPLNWAPVPARPGDWRAPEACATTILDSASPG
jgi:hypothetical protein